jgi:hypothetical protein
VVEGLSYVGIGPARDAGFTPLELHCESQFAARAGGHDLVRAPATGE